MSRVNASHEKDTSALKKADELDGEQKHEFLKRIAKENRTIAKGNKVTEEYYVIRDGMGARNKPIKKLIKVTRKANGGKYHSYVCRLDQYPQADLKNLDIRKE